jgi:hypothetical protein
MDNEKQYCDDCECILDSISDNEKQYNGSIVSTPQELENLIKRIYEDAEKFHFKQTAVCCATIATASFFAGVIITFNIMYSVQ